MSIFKRTDKTQAQEEAISNRDTAGARHLIASSLHTLVVLTTLACWTFGGLKLASLLGADLPLHRGRFYLLTVSFEWLMFAVVLAGLKTAGTPAHVVTGKPWLSIRAALSDLAVAGAFWLAATPFVRRRSSAAICNAN